MLLSFSSFISRDFATHEAVLAVRNHDDNPEFMKVLQNPENLAWYILGTEVNKFHAVLQKKPKSPIPPVLLNFKHRVSILDDK